MWIERLELIGFGNLSGKVIEFAKDKLNCVVEGNEYGKSTMAEAILAVLYDFPAKQKNTDEKLKEREARRPLSGEPFKVCIDIACQGRALRLVRDFGQKTLKVFDRDNADLEITREFLTGPNQDNAGRKLLGLGRELFKVTCFAGQGDLDDNALSNERRLSAVLQSLADSSGSSSTSASAIEVLNETLAGFPHQGKKIRLERVVKELEDRRDLYQQEINALEEEKLSVSDDLQRLSKLEDAVEGKDRQLHSAEYMQLCLEIADADQRLSSLQDRLLKAGDLKQQLSDSSCYKDFPINLLKPVEELWTKRQSRFLDHNRLFHELEDSQRQLSARDLKLREKHGHITQFTADEAGRLSGLAHTLANIQNELAEARQKHELERQRVEDSGIELDELAGVRQALLNLDAKEVDDAYAYHAMIKSAQEQIKDIEPSTWRARMIKSEIEEQRKTESASHQRIAQLLGILSVIVAGVAVGLWVAKMSGLPIIISAVAAAGLLVAAVISVIQAQAAKSLRRTDFNKAGEEEERQATLGQELHAKVVGFEVRLEQLARKAGVNNSAQLIKEIQTYASSASLLKDLDFLEHLIDSREQHSQKLIGELEQFFQKAGLGIDEITPEPAIRLAEQINQYLEEQRTLLSSTEMLNNKHTQLKFLADELRDLDTQLKDSFTQANLDSTFSIEKGYQEFCRAAEQYRNFESLSSDHNRLQELSSADVVPGDLAASISRLQGNRNVLWSRMEDLLARFPDIAQWSTTTTENSLSSNISSMRTELETLRQQREELRVHVRAATRNYDEYYLEALENLESIERELEHLRKTRQALDLAKETFQRLGKETHAHWANRLNEISRKMLQSLDTEYESLHFDEDLDLTARRKGQPEPLQPAQINSQLSTGTREQLHLLARMAVARFLSKDNALPIILDEPFSEADDQRFLNMMRFLVDTIRPQHQIILLSCHQQRHQSLIDQLPAEQKSNIQFCDLKASS